MAIPGFFWLYHGALAGGGRPGGRPPHAVTALDEDLRWLAHNNLRSILTLTEEPLPEEALHRFGLSVLHLPVRDLAAPTPDQFIHALEFIDQSRVNGRGVLVHCLVGQGRTGTILAAYLTRAGLPPLEAIQRIRALCPGAIGTPEQERAIETFAHRRDWIV